MATIESSNLSLATVEHNDELRRLQKILRHYRGFQLILILYNDPPDYRDRIINYVNQPFKQTCLLNVRDLPDFSAFEQQLYAYPKSVELIHVIGLDAWLLGERLKPLLQAFNRRRESIAQNCSKPLLLWLPQYLAKDFALYAPDCWEWRRAVVDFCYLPELENKGEIRSHSVVFSQHLPPVTTEIQLSDDWSHAQCLLEYNRIVDTLNSGKVQIALQLAKGLFNQALYSGITSYQNADFDMAMAQFILARVLKASGYAEAALERLQKVLLEFQILADGDDQSATRMISAALIEQGDCLRAIGQMDAAAEAYQQGIKPAEKSDDKRLVAVGKMQLATVRLLQKDYKTALEGYLQAREIFDQLNEPQAIATAWHHTGMAYRQMQEFEQAERAYREALAIQSKQGDNAGEANSLGELGNLYDDWGKLEQSVVFYRQALDIVIQLGNKAREGGLRSNIANILIKLQDYELARSELQQALECNKAFGHGALLWVTWDLLYDLEQACNDPVAAHSAKQRAIQCYLSYRRDGGENMSDSAIPKYCQTVLQSIAENTTDQAQKVLEELAGQQDLLDYLKPVIPILIGILQGQRQPTLADDPELDFNSAAELLLLLEQLK